LEFPFAQRSTLFSISLSLSLSLFAETGTRDKADNSIPYFAMQELACVDKRPGIIEIAETEVSRSTWLAMNASGSFIRSDRAKLLDCNRN